MLVLSRSEGQTIVIDGNIRLTVVRIRGGQVRLSFDAPDDVRIDREEIHNLQRDPISAANRRVH